MTRIVLTTEQSAVLADVKGRVPVCLPDGRVIGLFASYSLPATPFTPEEIAEAERGLDDPNTTWHTTDEVLAALRKQEDH